MHAGKCQKYEKGNKKEFEEVMKKILRVTEGEAAIKRVNESKKYILSNGTAVKLRLIGRENIKGYSVEGHVSHVLSRMSSRPMGWSRIGADIMAHLRAYYWNNGNMLELVR